MLQKISAISLSVVLIFGILCSPIFAEEQLPNSGGQSGPGKSAPVTEQTVIEPTQDEPAVIESETEEVNEIENTNEQIPHVIKPGTGVQSEPVEPTPIEDRKHKIEQGPGKGGGAPVKTEVVEVGGEPDKPQETEDPTPISEPIPVESKLKTAVPTNSTIIINGESVSFEAYLIGGNNYFKLRDLAYILSEEKTAEIIETKNVSDLEIIKDITTVQFTAYLVNGDIYFKLRDLGAAFDFGVDWDGETNTVIIDTNKSYTIN